MYGVHKMLSSNQCCGINRENGNIRYNYGSRR